MTMQSVDASVVIAPYLESVVRGRRVAVLGDATRPLGPALLERGARLVHVYDPDAARVAQVLAQRGSSRTLMTAPLPDGEVAVRDGAFDAVVVPDLTLFDPVDSIVARARKLVAAHGHALFVSPNPEAPPSGIDLLRERLLTYYELYDVIALQFPEVRMLGQAPFAGYVIADFAPEGDPDVVVDTSLVEREAAEPRWFMALGTNQPRRLDPYTIVQVPGDLSDVAVADTTAQRKLHEQVASLEKALMEAKSAVPIVPRVPAANERLEALEATLREREEALRRAEARAGDNNVRAGQLEGKVRDLEAELRHQRDRAFRLSNELEEEKKLRTKANLELRMVRGTSEMPPAKDKAAEARAEADRLERVLGTANEQIAKLESELAGVHERLANAERDLSAVRDELEDVRAEKEQVDARVVELLRDVAGRDSRIEELDGIVVDLQEATGDAELEQALEDTRHELQNAMAELEALRASQKEAPRATELEASDRARGEAKQALEKLRAERDDVAKALAVVEGERDEAKASLEVALSSLEAREGEITEMTARAQKAQRRGRGADHPALEQSRRERDEARAALEALRQEQEHDVSALERTLRERGQEIQRLQRDVRHHERLVRELLVRLEETGIAAATSTQGNGALRKQFSELSAEYARREGELQQTQWRIAELEHKVLEQTREQNPSAEVTELEHALFAAQNEMDALRQALSAEREARLQAENFAVHGGAARQADVQEQAVLDASIATQAEPEPDAG
jgi:chromosome segregation ATPase